MAVDLPPDGRVPDEADRELLEMFAVQAGVALSNARERERLTDRVRLDRMLTAVAGAGDRSRACPQALGTAVVAVAESPRHRQTWVRTLPHRRAGRASSASARRTPSLPEHDVPELREDLTRLEDLPVLDRARRRRPVVTAAARAARTGCRS